MAASDFTLIPTWVTPEAPVYSNIITKSEGARKNYLNISTTATRKYKLKFEGLSDAQFTAFIAHIDARHSGFEAFSWQSVPAYIDAGANKTGRWVDKSFKPKPKAKSWDATIVFEQDV